MKSPLLALSVCALLWPCAAHSATVLFSHTGSNNPATEGWSRSTSTTTVIGEAYNDNGTPVWRITDPGGSSGGTNLYYITTLNASSLNTVMTSGWELSATISVPNDYPTSGEAWGVDSNIWLGFAATEGAGRRYWALTFGRDASGNTRVTAAGSATTKTLTPGYHDYSLVYDPVTARVTISIDGEVWQTSNNGATASAGTNMLYWGDNNGQSSIIPKRSAYYESVQFSIGVAPEPSRLLLLAAGAMMVCGRRKRR